MVYSICFVIIVLDWTLFTVKCVVAQLQKSAQIIQM